MFAELKFGPVTGPGGGNIGPVAVLPYPPHVSEGFRILWTDWNVSQDTAAPPYVDQIWIADPENQFQAPVWLQEFTTRGLAPGQMQTWEYWLRPWEIAPGRYRFYVWINKSTLWQPGVPEYNYADNIMYNEIEVLG